MHYHHESLLQYEARQRFEESARTDLEASHRPSYRVTTPDWFQDADDKAELKQLLDDAILCGFNDSQVRIETLPF